MGNKLVLLSAIVAGFFLLTAESCGTPVQSVSGTRMKTAEKVRVGPDGLTVEQHNINARIDMDNTPGAIKHLYVISTYTGQVLIYSTVRGKVTSSGKRLTPDHVDGSSQFTFNVGESEFYTNQVLGEDGTYGPSIEYLYWWDSKGVYHQHYVTGGQMVEISDQPLAVKSIVINMELTSSKPEEK